MFGLFFPPVRSDASDWLVSAQGLHARLLHGHQALPQGADLCLGVCARSVVCIKIFSF